MNIYKLMKSILLSTLMFNLSLSKQGTKMKTIRNLSTSFSLGGKKQISYVPKTKNQKEYKKTLFGSKTDIVFCIGPAGTGKTLLACDFAIQSLKFSEVNKIVLTRPIISIEEDLGYLPGNINQKMHPWTIPMMDIFQEYYPKKDVTSMITENIIEIAPLGFMKGRTFKNCIVIADEMQNCTPMQMFMLMTRIGENSKMIITGDLKQTKNIDNGLHDIINKLENKYGNRDELQNDGFDIIRFDEGDIQRHKIVSKILDLY